MGKEVKLETAKAVEETKVQRVLGGDIETKTLDELKEAFDAVSEDYAAKTYPLSLSQSAISLLLLEILPNVEWVGQQAWDILEAQKVISELKPDVETQISTASVRSIFQFLATNKYKGVDNVMAVSDLLTVLATIIQGPIAADEQIFRDAGFEMQAAELGILPEKAMADAMAAQNAAAGH
jgi:hypothetical protein